MPRAFARSLAVASLLAAVAALLAAVPVAAQAPGVGLDRGLLGDRVHYRPGPGAANEATAPANLTAPDPFGSAPWPQGGVTDVAAYQARYGIPISAPLGGWTCGPSNELMYRGAAALSWLCRHEPDRIGSPGPPAVSCEPLFVEVHDFSALGGAGSCVQAQGPGWQLTFYAESQQAPSARPRFSPAIAE
jgi:hypothetical protein